MSSFMWKSFNLCFSKFKCLPTITFSSSQPTNNDDLDHRDDEGEDVIIDCDRSYYSSTTLFKNFNSLYDTNYYSNTSLTSSATFAAAATTTTDDFFSDDEERVPDFTSAFASQRFFFSSPGRSNSIFGEPPERPQPPPENNPRQKEVAGGVAVWTYSPDPFEDFRRSMVEMIEAREFRGNAKEDWESLHELLMCYLTLNPKRAHKFIISAFADVVVTLVSSNRILPRQLSHN